MVRLSTGSQCACTASTELTEIAVDIHESFTSKSACCAVATISNVTIVSSKALFEDEANRITVAEVFYAFDAPAKIGRASCRERV